MGGRKGRSAIVCAFRKLLTWEYFRYAKETMAAFPGDLQSNFDWMLAPINSIILMKKGMPKQACKCRAATVEGFERPVRTAAGTSIATYKYEEGDTRMGGEVQGKPDNMQLWTMTSDILLTIHDKICKGVTMLDATKKLVSRRTGDAYVDDKDLLEAASETNSAGEAVKNIQDSAQKWSNLVAATGQALAFHKCFWQMLAWVDFGGCYRAANKREVTSEHRVEIRDHRGISSEIEYRHWNESNEGLGVNLCPNANQKPEYEKRLKQTKELAPRVENTRFKIGDAWTALMMNTIPSITYSFSLTRFTKCQLHTLAVLVDNAFLPKLGVSRKMKRIAAYAPIKMGGFNFPSLETIQDQKNIMLVMRQLQLGQELATDLRIAISQAQLESGLTSFILDDIKHNLTYLEEGFIAHLRERLRELNGGIHVEGAWIPHLQRINDVSIMERLLELDKVTKRELEHANQCRKFLRVITIAEMATLCGRYIPLDRFTGRWRAKSTLKWPRQPRPTPEMWTTFRRLIKRAFCSQHKGAWRGMRQTGTSNMMSMDQKMSSANTNRLKGHRYMINTSKMGNPISSFKTVSGISPHINHNQSRSPSMGTVSKPAIHTPSQLIKRGRVGRMRTRKTRRQKSQGYKYYCQKRN
jgi:hypothetical protein